jgi:hypothetical protein
MKIPKSALLIFITGSLYPQNLNLVSCSMSSTGLTHSRHRTSRVAFLRQVVVNTRGGQGADTSSVTADVAVGESPSKTDKTDNKGNDEEEEQSLEDRVYAAMAKLGLTPPPQDIGEDVSPTQEGSNGDNCENGVCQIKPKPSVPSPDNKETFQEMKVRLAKEMNVDEMIVQAALGATLQVGVEPEEQRLNEDAARKMIQIEIAAIEKVMEDSEEVSDVM